MNNHVGLTLTQPTGSVLFLAISLKLQYGIRLKPTSLDSLDSSEPLDVTTETGRCLALINCFVSSDLSVEIRNLVRQILFS